MSKIPFRQSLLKRLTDIANYEKIGTPFKKFGKYYFYKNDGLQNQSVLYVQDNLESTPRVFLDPNKLSDDGTVALTGISFSNDGKYMEIFMGSVLAGDNAATPSPYDFALGGEGLDPSIPGGVNGSLLQAGQSVMVS